MAGNGELKEWVVRRTEVINIFGPDIETERYMVFSSVAEQHLATFTDIVEYGTKLTEAEAHFILGCRFTTDKLQGFDKMVVSRKWEAVQV